MGKTRRVLASVLIFSAVSFAASCATHVTGGGGDGGTNPPNDGGKPYDAGWTEDASYSGCKTAAIPQDYASLQKSADHVLLAWNDLGMHCLNPSYDSAVILPPYNTIWAQVVQMGNPPKVVTSGLSVDYSIPGNTYSYGKGSYGGFWDNSESLFGTTLQKDRGLNLLDSNIHNGLSGGMAEAAGDHFHAEGIPVVPVDDSGAWNPFQAAELALKSGGNVIARTRTTIPTSDEIDCAKCHGSDALKDVLVKHDAAMGTKLASAGPVLCASCHGSPALGLSGPGTSGKYLSGAVHSFHADKNASCYDCHPGMNTRCSRSIPHTAADGNCTTCHGQLKNVGDSVNSGARIPWKQEPKCVTCHSGVPEVDTGDTLYRNAKGHGGLYCEACHGSPHAMVPTCKANDNFQAMQYQGKAVTLGDCRVCHKSSRGGGDEGEGSDGFAEAHGGTNPEHKNACHTCHTVVPTDTSKWPHAYGWRARN